MRQNTAVLRELSEDLFSQIVANIFDSLQLLNDSDGINGTDGLTIPLGTWARITAVFQHTHGLIIGKADGTTDESGLVTDLMVTLAYGPDLKHDVKVESTWMPMEVLLQLSQEIESIAESADEEDEY